MLELIQLILGSIILAIGGLAWGFKSRADREATRADAEAERADREKAANQAQGRASQALADTAARQRESRTPPNTQDRNDLENDW